MLACVQVTDVTAERRQGPTIDEAVPEVLSQWHRIEHATRTLDRAVRMTQMADAKVAPVLALHATLAAVTVSQSAGLGDVLTADSVAVWRTAAAWGTLAAYIALSLLAFRQVAIVYIPTAPVRGRRKHHGHSLFYFDDIQSMDYIEFAARSKTVDLDALEEDVLHQVHVVSSISASKLGRVQTAYTFSGLTLISWMVFMVVTRA